MNSDDQHDVEVICLHKHSPAASPDDRSLPPVDVASAVADDIVRDDVYHGDGYSVRLLSREESRRAGLEGYEPQIVARQQSTEEFLAFLDTIPAADEVASAARPTPHANL